MKFQFHEEQTGQRMENQSQTNNSMGGTFLDKSLFKVQITCDTRSYWGGEEKQRQRRES
jgi:hypothetical protein